MPETSRLFSFTCFVGHLARKSWSVVPRAEDPDDGEQQVQEGIRWFKCKATFDMNSQSVDFTFGLLALSLNTANRDM